MKICRCGELIDTSSNKDFAICGRCNEVVYVNESERSKNEDRLSGKRKERPNTMGFSR